MVYRPGVSLTDDGSQGCAESQIVNILSNHNKWPSLEQQPWWRHIKAPFYERSGVTIVSIVSMTSHQHLTQTDLYTSHNLPFVLSEPRQIKLGSGRELSGPLLAAGLLLYSTSGVPMKHNFHISSIMKGRSYNNNFNWNLILSPPYFVNNGITFE